MGKALDKAKISRKFFIERFKRKPEADEYYYNEWVDRINRVDNPEELRGIADSKSMKVLKKHWR